MEKSSRKKRRLNRTQARQVPMSSVGVVPTEIASTSSATSSSTSTQSEKGHGGELDVEDLLECPICFNMSTPPIYICVSGHSICHNCRDRIRTIKNECPSCRQPLNDGRNFSLEAVYNSTRFNCTFKQFGCEERVRGSDFNKHVQECHKRPFTCDSTTMNQSLSARCGAQLNSIDSLLCHFTEFHFSKKGSPGSYYSHKINLRLMNTEGGSYPLICWESQGEVFLEQLYKRGNIYYINILLLGEKLETQRYRADLHLIRKGHDCAPNILKGIFPIEVRSIREPFEEVKKFAIGFSETHFLSEICRIDEITQEHFWMTRFDVKLMDDNYY